MAQGLATTFEVLGKTENDAAVATLVAMLDSPHSYVAEEAVRCLLVRRSPRGKKAILERLHEAPPNWHDILMEFSGRLSSVLRDAVLGTDETLCRNACDLALRHAEYDLIPPLINVAEETSHPSNKLAQETLLELTNLLYQELAAPRDYRRRRDPQLVRRHMVASLEKPVERYSRHKQRAIVEAYLMLVQRNDASLKRVLQNPHGHAYLAVIDTLTHSSSPGVMRLALNYLDDESAPSAALRVVSHRTDPCFINHLLDKVGTEPPKRVQKNLRRIEDFAWLQGDLELLSTLSDQRQQAALVLARATKMTPSSVFSLIEYLLHYGSTGSRRAAVVALADHAGIEANQLAEAALHDRDPKVQAAAYSQLRARGIPGAINRLIEQVDSPFQEVRSAVRESLTEFSFDRFSANFDMLEESVRSSTGVLVKKVDSRAIPRLCDELQHQSRARRKRAVEMIAAMEAAPELEEQLAGMLVSDEDHMVRIEVCRALGACRSDRARAALQLALGDRSPAVQVAAQEMQEQS